MQTLEKRGVPNHYGTQRFGYRRNTHRLGRMILARDWDGLAAEMLGTTGSWFPAHQRGQREAFEAGRYDEAAKGWGRRDVAERGMAAAIAKGRSTEEAVATVSRQMRTFWVSALQSSIFNHLLEARMRAGTTDRILEGDVAFRHESRKSFLADAGMMARLDSEARVNALFAQRQTP